MNADQAQRNVFVESVVREYNLYGRAWRRILEWTPALRYVPGMEITLEEWAKAKTRIKA